MTWPDDCNDLDILREADVRRCPDRMVNLKRNRLSMATNSAEGIRWNLSDLFAAHDDPQIEATLKNCHGRAEAFAERFRSQMEQPNTLTAGILLQALNELESIYEALG